MEDFYYSYPAPKQNGGSGNLTFEAPLEQYTSQDSNGERVRFLYNPNQFKLRGGDGEEFTIEGEDLGKIFFSRGVAYPAQWEAPGVYNGQTKTTFLTQATQNKNIYFPDKEGTVALTNDVVFDNDSEVIFTGDNDTNSYTPPNYVYSAEDPTTGFTLGRRGIRFLSSNPGSSIFLKSPREGEIAFVPVLKGGVRFGVNQFNRWLGFWGTTSGGPWWFDDQLPVYLINSWWKGYQPWEPAPHTTRLGRIEFRLGDYATDYWPDKIACTMESTGVLPAIGFLGAEPEIRQPGGEATAGSTWGENERSMLEKAYRALRAFGLIE